MFTAVSHLGNHIRLNYQQREMWPSLFHPLATNSNDDPSVGLIVIEGTDMGTYGQVGLEILATSPSYLLK